MNVLGIRDFERRASLHGFLAGYGLPLLIVIVPWMAGRLDRLLVQGWIYFLLPAFAACGLVTALLMWWAYPTYGDRAPAIGFANGCLWGGWAVGALLLWAATPDRPLMNRLLVASFGAPLMVAFWEWIGALMAYAARQRREAEPQPL